MLITKTARPEIRNNTRYFGSTLSVYRDALQYVNSVVMAEWVNIAPIPGQGKDERCGEAGALHRP
ncbi:MAG: hypothetical protein ABR903_04610 [Thermodesulfovibrionales bacterium]|jgi:hypothetical protein